MRAARWLVPGMFFVSGACGLVYEVVWTRMLVVAFGATVWAASTVLSAFMGGMALGSYMFGRAADRHPDPLRLYAYLELGVGGFALAFPGLLGRVERVYSAWGGGLGTRFVLCFGVLALPTVLMG
ncbi:MAG: spermidine synthase, partial [Candidatus Latescibacterota bacterium]